MKKAVIFARYSRDSQTEQSIDGQLRVCKEYAEKNGYEIVAEYIDRAMTGTNDNRPDFQRMIKDSFNKKWEYVLVYKFDRFSRDKYQSTLHKHTLKQNGVKVISAMENIPDTPEGIILESLLEGMNQYYSAELSQKVKRGLKESRIKGLFTGGPTPYGYKVKDKKVSINEEKANIVREYMFNQYYSGKRIKDIVALLAEKGIKNSYDKSWTINMVSRVLRNPNYKGCVYADNTCYTNIFPAIVSEEVFDEVNARLKVAKRTSVHFKTDVHYLLSGKLACGKCGGLMTGDSGKVKWARFTTTTNALQRKRIKTFAIKSLFHKKILKI